MTLPGEWTATRTTGWDLQEAADRFPRPEADQEAAASVQMGVLQTEGDLHDGRRSFSTNRLTLCNRPGPGDRRNGPRRGCSGRFRTGRARGQPVSGANPER